MVLVSLVIPTYNEAGNVRPLAEAIAKAFGGIDYEIIFVDDKSPDGTAKAITGLPDFGKKIRLIERPGKLGLASAVVEGAASASGRWILVMDGDLSHPPETARKMFDSRDDADLIVASRNALGGGKSSGWSASRDLISRSAEILCKPFVDNRTSDPLSGFFLIKRGILTNTKIRVRGYKILLNIIFDNPGMKISDVPYIFEPRLSGVTKLNSAEIATYVFDLGRLAFGRKAGSG
jgi:dolichol-phosphate mannosyltransferase